MQYSGRVRAAAVALLAGGALAGSAVIAEGGAAAHPARAAAAAPSVKRFSMAGYVLNADYTRGRNTGNTFQQTYKAHYDYAPGSLHPESTGTVTIVKQGSTKPPA